jgi:hypothetical protein
MSVIDYTKNTINFAHNVPSILYVIITLLLLTYVILVIHFMMSYLIGCSEILCQSLHQEQESGRKWQAHADWNHFVLEHSCSTYMILESLGNICVYFLNNLTHCMKRHRLEPIYVGKFNNQKWGNVCRIPQKFGPVFSGKWMPKAWIMGILCTFLHLKYVQQENPHRPLWQFSTLLPLFRRCVKWGNLVGIHLPGLSERKGKYIWIPFLDPEDIRF